MSFKFCKGEKVCVRAIEHKDAKHFLNGQEIMITSQVDVVMKFISQVLITW